MKKIVLSMGLAAGSAALQMTCGAQVMSADSPKWWNVAASLNGFYDSNYATTSAKRGSYGFELSPTASINVPMPQTDFGLTYTYDLQYFQQRDDLRVNPYDQSHTVGLWLDHSFNERWSAKVNESFVSGQEPELQGPGNATPFRAQGNNIVNRATLEVDTEITREFSTALTIGNNFIDYNNNADIGAGGSSYAALLNRVEDTFNYDVQWHIAPETMAYVGYGFEIVNYTTDDSLGNVLTGAGTQADPFFLYKYYSNDRDNYSHLGYVGIQHNFLPNLVVAGKVGIQYNDAYNNPYYDSTALSPYVNLSVIYTYLTGCNVQLGFTQSRNATDIANISSSGSLTQDQETSAVHVSINHRITSKFYVSAIGTYTAGTFNGGSYNNETDNDFGVGLGANYAFTKNFSANVNYNYDSLESSIVNYGYDRNRISVGLSVAY